MPELTLPILYLLATILFCWEHFFPAHPIEAEYQWYLRAIFINIFQLGIFFVVDGLWMDSPSAFSLFHLDSTVSPITGALLAYFIFTFVIYWWHRLRHSSDIIWRYFHQFHHSPKRIQTLTAYYIHPLDMTVNLFISNSIVFVLLGLNFEAASCYTLITGFAGFFIHANIRVPRQLGYVFQTPEMHRLHHKVNHHANNYSDIVCWDMLFGTYHNPVEDVETCGFDDETESKVFQLLAGRKLV